MNCLAVRFLEVQQIISNKVFLIWLSTPNESILADGASGLKTCDLYTLDGIEFNESLVIKITGQATAYNSAHYWCIELSE